MIRETLLNAMHREYSFSGSKVINVCHDRMEFISMGGLTPGLSETDIRVGISQLRNKNLANIFYRLRHIESYGTGIRRIFTLYNDHPKQPDLMITDNTFTMILPNMNARSFERLNKDHLSPQEKTIIEYLQSTKRETEENIQSVHYVNNMM